MKKNNNKKGFTIVELVIVIAVIAILAAVLIPTFSNVIEKSNNSAALQEARNVYTEIYAVDISDGTLNLTKDNHGVTLPNGAEVQNYAYTGANVTEFKYKSSKGIVVTFNGTTWTTGS